VTRLIQLTHGDMDGAACAVVASRMFPDVKRDTRFCQYGDGPDSIDAVTRQVISNRDEDDERLLLITDMCPSREVCDEIDRVKEEFKSVLVVDHHETSTRALDYAWTKIDPDNMMCGAKLLLDGNITPDELLLEFVESVDAYDRWQLESEYRERGVDLNRLFYFLGPTRFVTEFSSNPGADKDMWLSRIPQILRDKQDRDIEKLRATYDKDSDGREVAFLVVSDNVSEVGHTFLNNYPNLDYVIMALPGVNAVSLRSRDGGVNVADIAKKSHPDGGGHQAAAGFPCKLSTLLWDNLKGKF